MLMWLWHGAFKGAYTFLYLHLLQIRFPGKVCPRRACEGLRGPCAQLPDGCSTLVQAEQSLRQVSVQERGSSSFSSILKDLLLLI